jgi:hypothetical protein
VRISVTYTNQMETKDFSFTSHTLHSHTIILHIRSPIFFLPPHPPLSHLFSHTRLPFLRRTTHPLLFPQNILPTHFLRHSSVAPDTAFRTTPDRNSETDQHKNEQKPQGEARKRRNVG